MVKLERITEETLTPEHTERVRRAVLGIPRKNSVHRAILADCARVLTGDKAARATIVRTWNAMVTPIDELIENSSLGAAMRDIKERGLDAHLKTLDEELRPKRRVRRKP
jgi:hypothetical protein